jgi:hypothetical protein
MDKCIPCLEEERPIPPSKSMAFKDEIEKLHKVDFIYLITYMSWVSNLVPINKRKVTIWVCSNVHDINQACPKSNFPTLFIDEVINK